MHHLTVLQGAERQELRPLCRSLCFRGNWSTRCSLLGQTLTAVLTLLLETQCQQFLVLCCFILGLDNPLLLESNSTTFSLQGDRCHKSLNLRCLASLLSCHYGKSEYWSVRCTSTRDRFADMGPPQLLIDKTGISLLEAINKSKPLN